jgi:hypothetical protein
MCDSALEADACKYILDIKRARNILRVWSCNYKEKKKKKNEQMQTRKMSIACMPGALIYFM